LCELYSGTSELQALDNIFQQGAAQGQSFFAASGDAGAYDCGDTSLWVDSPADDPNVVGVGGTTLQTGSGGSYSSESIWSDPSNTSRGPEGAGGGGGLSGYFAKPSYQIGPGTTNSYSNGMRQVPDVSANADPNTGYSVYCTASASGCPASGWVIVGGTSAAAPLWSSIAADLNQYLAANGKPVLGNVNSTLYFLFNTAQPYAAYHDITSGNNLYYPATSGYDQASGIGTPDVWNMARDLVAADRTSDFSISASPASITIYQSSGGASSINTAVVAGSAGTVNLTTRVAPASGTYNGGTLPTVSLNQSSISAGGSSTLTVSADYPVNPGVYIVTINGNEGIFFHSTTVTVTVLVNFVLSASPTSLTIPQGTSAVSKLSNARGSGNDIAVTASVSPSGPTLSLSSPFVPPYTSGTILTVSIDPSVAPGNYTVTVTGTLNTTVHSLTIGVTVISPGNSGGMANGGFETGTLSNWTSSGVAAISSAAHTGSDAVQVGSAWPTRGDSSISQTFTVATGYGSLSFWYKVACPDTVNFDWATAALRDNTASATTTMLPHICSNTSAWVQVSAPVTAGHSYTLTLSSHDDNYPGDGTYTLFDDVTLAAPAPNPFINGDFEDGGGGLNGWTTMGWAHGTPVSHSGSWGATAGFVGGRYGDSTISQTVTVPAGDTTLSFWYKVVCPDTVTYDWATATLQDNTANTTTTVLPHTCTNNDTWVKVTARVIPGHSYTLTLIDHDDGWVGDPTYTYFDDVSIS
ncbi:MAG TPA: hypothetical protein VFW17_15090, partial [Ktedonobacterales bacterium]|nr:hypothetical protein [Ktedonobacterales bacterium]